MQTAALFVDAGYVIATSCKAKFGERVSRHELRVADTQLADALVDRTFRFAEQREGPMRLLRVYWYDAAPEGVPAVQHRNLAAHPTVKLRLGRLTPQGQKGVDAKLILDLVTLSREKAIDVAVVVSGDEDVREAVEEAQKMGVRVLLIGVQLPAGGSDQSQTLIWESDEHHLLPSDFWAAYVDRVPASISDDVDAGELGEAFAVGWLNRASAETLQDLVVNRPRIDASVDAELMRYACDATGVMQIDDESRRQLRAGFWRGITSGTGSP